MNGCHIPNCLSRCCMGLKNEIAALQQDVERNKSFVKRLIALEKQPSRTNEEVAQLAQYIHDFVGSINGRVQRIEHGRSDESITCVSCKGKGKSLFHDLSVNAQGEGDRWTVIDCAKCKGKGVFNI